MLLAALVLLRGAHPRTSEDEGQLWGLPHSSAGHF